MGSIAWKYHYLAQQSISDNKIRDKIFSDKNFSCKLCWSCSTIVTIQKNEFYCFKISFLVQQSISGNKSRDKIFSDKNCSWKFRWSRSTIITKKEMSSNPWLCHFRGLTKHIRKDLMGLALQSFYYQNGYESFVFIWSINVSNEILVLLC